ncbi:hypothetical protein M406DRAFT_267603 [Cryphonectria parasitica EP155]|uniref:DUF1308 domain-containing protein n=1 Tax=Cryphonectria parasitica (strain ATCC 38755 / EP155) TaxID=660469 RepID=A0A9P5CK18_CRYP1|nr:uncharacterized protein M406DRAFT_267603 [Cryphonectria parasitica EP155]KAF3760712.1 hypothetical protein M406DRAFT_267603 [Cryphonectria parasitica EP155]
MRSDVEAAESYLASLANPAIKWKPGKGSPLSAAARFRSSNVHAVELHWNIVKRCRHLVSVNQQLPKAAGQAVSTAKTSRTSGKAETVKGLICVHAVVDGGAEWIRIITKDQKRLLIEMAEGGWDWGSDGEANDNDDDNDSALYEDVATLRQTKEIIDVARSKWHNYRHPRIRIILTRVKEGQNEEIDRLIGKLRGIGGSDINVKVYCAESNWVTNKPPVPVDTAISNLLPQEEDVGETILLDTSVLIALVSDICHTKVAKMPWMERDLQTHIEDENKGNNFIPSLAASRLRGKKLICTKQAIAHFTDITRTIGSPTEVERARVLLEGVSANLQKLSIHHISDDLMLPLHVLPGEETALCAESLVRDGVLPEVALEVDKHLESVAGNRATHLYGWASGLTVVTSNRALTSKIVRTVEASLAEDYEGGPRICALPYNRALVTCGPSPDRARELQRRGIWAPGQTSNNETDHVSPS